MAEDTKIQWATHTFNPWRGCTKISAGCTNCYADTMSKRNPSTLGVWGPKGTRVVAAEAAWKEPVKWNKQAEAYCDSCKSACFEWQGTCRGCGNKCRKLIGSERPRVFCASLADVFESWEGPMLDSAGHRLWSMYQPSGTWWPEGEMTAGHSDKSLLTMQDVRNRLFALIDATPNLDWLLLTKRPENIARMMPMPASGYHHGAYRSNVWVGTSCENQQAADERIPHLLRVPAAVRFLSCEPLLSQTILHKYFAQCECGHGHGFTACPNTGGVAQTCHKSDCKQLRSKISWVIVGGESGHGARPMDVAWARSIVERCKAAGVACFVKQLGSAPYTELIDLNNPHYRGSMSSKPKDKKGGDMAEFPRYLQVREFPK